ncbi:hypothetical protein ACOME3_010167 [Neoechinorhynchus agilis]
MYRIDRLPTTTTTTCPSDAFPCRCDEDYVVSSISEAAAGARLHVQQSIDNGLYSNWFLMPNLKTAFDLFDANKDGYISQGELCKVIRQLGISKSKQVARRIMRKVDADGNGLIDFNEFNRYIDNDLIGSTSSSHKRNHRADSGNSDRTSADASSSGCADAYAQKSPMPILTHRSSDLSEIGERSSPPIIRRFVSSCSFFESKTEAQNKISIEPLSVVNSIDESSGIQSLPSSLENMGYGEKRTDIKTSQDVLDRMTPVTVLSRAFQSREELNNFVWRMFKAFDINKDGYIRHDEIKRRMRLLGFELDTQEIDEMINVADTNHDGLIDFYEFAQMIYRTCNERHVNEWKSICKYNEPVNCQARIETSIRVFYS